MTSNQWHLITLLSGTVHTVYCVYVLCVGIDAQAGINIWMNAGIALLICFSILTTIIIIVNLIHRRYNKN